MPRLNPNAVNHADDEVWRAPYLGAARGERELQLSPTSANAGCGTEQTVRAHIAP